MNDGVKRVAAGDAVVFDHTVERKGGSRGIRIVVTFYKEWFSSTRFWMDLI